MEESEVRQLAEAGLFEKAPLRGKLEETHISWVILSGKYAFKIKKPLKLSFLDFSSLSLRKYYCEREVELNSRFTDIYLGVLPVSKHNGKWCMGEKEGPIEDYIVMMKRLQTAKRMDMLLTKRTVSPEDIKRLSKTITSFHDQAEKVFEPFNLSKARDIFNTITEIRDLVGERLGLPYIEIIDSAVEQSDCFLNKHSERLQDRIDKGLKRDVHGDLHSGNIFLYKKPVLFDCIEFNDAYRQIDLLYEVAFLCMDLEAYEYQHLSDYFLNCYRQEMKVLENPEDEKILSYFKGLRANIRAKVHALSVMEAVHKRDSDHHLNEVRTYLDLLQKYMRGKEV